MLPRLGLADDGASELIRTIYTEHHSWLHGWLRKKLGCAHHAADLAHDTFLRLFDAREKASLREPRAYLSKIAQGLMANHWRRLEIERAYLDALAVLPEPASISPLERSLILEALAQIDAMLARLSERARHAFLLAQLEGLTYAEIGERLGVSERMIKKYMAQAMLACLVLKAELSADVA